MFPRRGGSPHVTGIDALWHEGSFWFETGRGTRKARNLARDPRCTLIEPGGATRWRL
jgi:Pyridoxamine 5'-phosphate oxidase